MSQVGPGMLSAATSWLRANRECGARVVPWYRWESLVVPSLVAQEVNHKPHSTMFEHV